MSKGGIPKKIRESLVVAEWAESSMYRTAPRILTALARHFSEDDADAMHETLGVKTRSRWKA